MLPPTPSSRSSARAEFDKGQEALASGDFKAASDHFTAAKQNQYADSATVSKADEQLAVVQKQMEQSGSDAKSLYKKGRAEFRKGDWIAARKDLTAAQDGGYKPGFLEPAPSEKLAKMDSKEKADAAKAQAQADAQAAPAPQTPAAPAPDASPKAPESAAAAPAAPAPTTAPATAAPAVAPSAVATAAPTDNATAPAPTTAPAAPDNAAPAAPEAAPAPAADTKAQARAAYLKGREEYRKGDWIAAREDLTQAQSLNFKQGLFEDSPAKYLARMDAKENADAAKAAQANAQTPAPAAPTTAPTDTTTAPPATNVAVTPPTSQPAPAPEAAAPTVQEQLQGTAHIEDIRKQQNAYEARQLVEKADQAKREGRNTEAINDYGQAVLLYPTNHPARQGRQQMMEQEGLTEGNPNRLSAEIKHDLDIRRDRVNQLVTQYLDTANADIQRRDFTDATKQIDLARTVVATDNTIFTRDELAGFTSRIDGVDHTRAEQQALSESKEDQVAREKAKESIQKAQEQARLEQELHHPRSDRADPGAHSRSQV